MARDDPYEDDEIGVEIESIPSVEIYYKLIVRETRIDEWREVVNLKPEEV